jgi:hypothetical protein
VLLSLLGWGVVIVPVLAIAVWLGVDALSVRTTAGQLTGSACDGLGREAVAYRFTVGGHDYTQWTPWDADVPATLLAEARKRQPIEIWYLPRDPHHSYLSPPSPMQLPAHDWVLTNIKLIPTVGITFVAAVAMHRRRKRIARAISLAKHGRMSQGMVFRRASSRSRTSKTEIDGFPINMCWEILQSPSQHPDAIRYEFVVDLKKRFGYIPPSLLGIFRSDGLVGVVYDPLHPDLHLPLPVIERYLIIS